MCVFGPAHHLGAVFCCWQLLADAILMDKDPSSTKQPTVPNTVERLDTLRTTLRVSKVATCKDGTQV